MTTARLRPTFVPTLLLTALLFLVSSAPRIDAQGACPTIAEGEDLGGGSLGSNGVPVLAASGTPIQGLPYSLRVTDGRALDVGLLFISAFNAPTPVPGTSGVFYPAQPWFELPFLTDSDGASPSLLDLAALDSEFCGGEVWAQALVLDAGATGGFAISNALRIVIGSVDTTPPPLGSPIPTAVALDPHTTLTSDASVLLSGTTDGLDVEINGPLGLFTVPVVGGSFSASVFLADNRANHLTLTPISDLGQRGAPVVTTVTRDSQAPEAFVDFPPDGVTVTTPVIDVAGRVSDMLSGFAGIEVTVNGVDAEVDAGIGTNGTFFLSGVPLAPGTSTPIVVEARDVLGNSTTRMITIAQADPTGAVMTVIGGNAQRGVAGNELAQPLEVLVETAGGQPFEGKVVTFEVTRSGGRLASMPGGIGAERSLQVKTGRNGIARAYWTLGSDAGCGSNRAEVTSKGIAGSAFFCASARAAGATMIAIGDGDDQRAQVSGPAPNPLRVWVSDGENPVRGQRVRFTVEDGDGRVDGSLDTTVVSDATGHAEVRWLLGAEPGSRHRVRASIEDSNGVLAPPKSKAFGATPLRRPTAGPPSVVFQAVALERDDLVPTSLSGVVTDNARRPIGNAPCSLTVSGLTFAATTDSLGRFDFPDTLVSGPAKLHVTGLAATLLDGMTVPVGSFPDLEFQLTLVPNSVNRLPGPVLLPALDPQNARPYSTTVDTVLSVVGIDGLSMRIAPGSMTIGGLPAPDGTVVALNQVHFDEIPMPMPDGAAPPFAWTLQPSGAHFDPPIEITIPNMSGLPAGAIVYFLSFDHAVEQFQIVSSGSVTEDGLCLVTDSGDGLSVAGWGGFCPPYPPPTELLNCAGTDLWGIAKSGFQLIITIIDLFTKIEDKLKCAIAAVGAVDDAVTTYDTVSADGTLTPAETIQLLSLVDSAKSAVVTCVAAFIPDPGKQAGKAEKIVETLNDAISAALAFPECLPTGVEAALRVVDTLNDHIALLIDLATDLKVKDALLMIACGTLEFINNVLSQVDGADMDPIPQLDILFADLVNSSVASQKVDPDIKAFLRTQKDIEQADTDLQGIVADLEVNPALAGCTIRVRDQVATANEGGGFVVTNIPTGGGLQKATVTCEDADPPLYGQSIYLDLVDMESLLLDDVILLSTTPPPTVTGLTPVLGDVFLTSPGEQTQLTLTASFSDDTQGDVTPRSLGSVYTSSNAEIASVDLDGLVTAVGDGVAFLTASNEGVTSVIAVRVSLGDPLTTLEGFVAESDGTPVSGAAISVSLTGDTTTSDAAGFFQVAGLPSALSQLTVTARANVSGQELFGSSAAITPVAGGITDAGLIVLSPVVEWISDLDGAWTDGSKWSTGMAPGPGSAVLIARSGADPVVTLASGSVSVASVTVDDELLVTGAGTVMEVTDLIEVTGTFRLESNAVLQGGELLTAGDVLLSQGDIFGMRITPGFPGARIDVDSVCEHDDVTYDADVWVGDGILLGLTDLTLNGTLFLNGSGAFNFSQFNSDTTSTLHGTGTIQCNTGSNNNIVRANNGGTLTLSPTITLQGNKCRLGSNNTGLVNEGVISLLGANVESDDFVNAPGGLIESLGGIWTFPGDMFTNHGELRAVIDAPFVGFDASIPMPATWSNTGTILISGKNVVLICDGTWSNTGTITCAGPDAELELLEWASQDFGSITVSAGRASLGGSFDINDLQALAITGSELWITGTLDTLGATVDIDVGGNTWELQLGTIIGGTIDGTELRVRSTSLADGVVFNSDVFITNGTTLQVANGMELHGLLTLNSQGSFGGIFTSLQFTDDTPLSGTGTIQFLGDRTNNHVRSVSGTLTIGPDILIRTTGGGGTVGQLGTGVINEGTIFGTRNFPGPIILAADPWENRGTLDADLIKGFRATGDFIQTAGTILMDGGEFEVAGLFDIQGGILTGTGLLDGDLTVSGGTLAPGDSPGAFTIEGNYTQTAGGTLAIELGGLTAGSGYDQLVIQGAASFGGTLDVTLFGGFMPAGGNSFDIATYATPSATPFDTLNGLDLGAVILGETYGATALTLDAVQM